jgi:hypothetical protein
MAIHGGRVLTNAVLLFHLSREEQIQVLEPHDPDSQCKSALSSTSISYALVLSKTFLQLSLHGKKHINLNSDGIDTTSSMIHIIFLAHGESGFIS